MKNRVLKTVLFAFLPFTLLQLTTAQVPQGLNYMAIARDENKNIIPDTDIKIRIAILRTITPLDVEWEEEQIAHTNETGLFRITVGDKNAAPVDGCHAAKFKDINWKIQPLYIRTYIDIKGSWESIGDAELLSVPYAMMAGQAYGVVDNPITMVGDTMLFSNSIDVVGDNLAMDEAIFEVKRNDGQTMFAVYNQGVRINVPLIDAVKGVKGGFAIGGFSGSKTGSITNLFTLNKDSARIYVDKTPDLTKGAKGGFAVGGFDLAGKAPAIQEYLSITPDSARIYVKDSGKASKGGFAVGGFGAKSTPTNFLNITPLNYFIGHESGSKIKPTGLYNSVIGYQAGKSLTTGGYNTILGYLAGTSLNTGNNNIVIGNNAGKSMTSGIHNTLIGNGAGYNHTNQQYNIMIGTTAGYNAKGSYNTFIGINAGYKIDQGINNVFLGTNAGAMLENGSGNTVIGIDAGRSGAWDPYDPHGFFTSDNTIIGNNAGYNLDIGDNNVFVGTYAGSSVSNASGNIFVGFTAGSEETGSNKLYITNRTRDDDDNPLTPLIYGDFSLQKLGINTTTLTKTLNVGGDAAVSGNLTAGSITGAVTGNITGNVNGMTMGKVFLTATGNIVSIMGGTFALNWEKTNNWIEIINTNSTVPCNYWYQVQDGATTSGGSDQVAAPSNKKIIAGPNTANKGFEIHFGQADGAGGWCSVWLQYYNGAMVGHYIKY